MSDNIDSLEDILKKFSAQNILNDVSSAVVSDVKSFVGAEAISLLQQFLGINDTDQIATILQNQETIISDLKAIASEIEWMGVFDATVAQAVNIDQQFGLMMEYADDPTPTTKKKKKKRKKKLNKLIDAIITNDDSVADDLGVIEATMLGTDGVSNIKPPYVQNMTDALSDYAKDPNSASLFDVYVTSQGYLANVFAIQNKALMLIVSATIASNGSDDSNDDSPTADTGGTTGASDPATLSASALVLSKAQSSFQQQIDIATAATPSLMNYVAASTEVATTLTRDADHNSAVSCWQYDQELHLATLDRSSTGQILYVERPDTGEIRLKFKPDWMDGKDAYIYASEMPKVSVDAMPDAPVVAAGDSRCQWNIIPLAADVATPYLIHSRNVGGYLCVGSDGLFTRTDDASDPGALWYFRAP